MISAQFWGARTFGWGDAIPDELLAKTDEYRVAAELAEAVRAWTERRLLRQLREGPARRLSSDRRTPSLLAFHAGVEGGADRARGRALLILAVLLLLGLERVDDFGVMTEPARIATLALAAREEHAGTWTQWASAARRRGVITTGRATTSTPAAKVTGGGVVLDGSAARSEFQGRS